MTQTYEILADLLEYPEAEWPELLRHAKQQVVAADSGLFSMLLAFCKGVEPFDVTALQELYTRTFDLNPVCALEIGYHLFGENYKRGEMLANLREMELPYELGQQHQLPDYLPVLLRLLVRIKRDDLRNSLIGECILPALLKMLGSFDATDNPYAHLIGVVHRALKQEVPEATTNPAVGEMPELYRISSRADSRSKEQCNHV